jgi:hypothetical protein
VSPHHCKIGFVAADLAQSIRQPLLVSEMQRLISIQAEAGLERSWLYLRKTMFVSGERSVGRSGGCAESTQRLV